MLHEYTLPEVDAQQLSSSSPDIPRSTLLDGICSDFELGYVKPEETLWRLQKAGLLATPQELAAVFVAGFRALQDGGAR